METEFKTILCPTDFSDGSERALQYATEWAKTFGARLRLLHVFQLPLYVGFEDGAAAVAASSQYLDGLRKTVQERLDKVLAECRAAGVEAEAKLVEGAVHRAIVEESANVDLIVMGTHGRSGLPRLVLGSVAERTVRLAECPVLTIPPPESDAE